jgi:hypothetical protein
VVKVHQGMGFPSRKKPPDGPLSGRVAAQSTLAAPSVIGRAPISSIPGAVAVRPGATELTRMPVPSSSAASLEVRALTAALEMP